MTKPRYQPIKKEQIPEVLLPLGVAPPENSSNDDSVLGKVRIIAGEFGSQKGAAETFSPVQMWDVQLPNAGSEVDLPFPADHNCIVFVRRGSVDVLSGEENLKSSTLGPQDVALMRMDGSDVLRLRVNKPDTSVMILGGEPIDEPIAARGPFGRFLADVLSFFSPSFFQDSHLIFCFLHFSFNTVMNTQEEIHQAIVDFQRGRMGK
jgi:redox-sensitive bicupin YhaK (pirin superfamily)